MAKHLLVLKVHTNKAGFKWIKRYKTLSGDFLRVRSTRRWESNWLKHRTDRESRRVGARATAQEVGMVGWGIHPTRRSVTAGEYPTIRIVDTVVGNEEEGVTYSFQEAEKKETVAAHQLYMFFLFCVCWKLVSAAIFPYTSRKSFLKIEKGNLIRKIEEE